MQRLFEPLEERKLLANFLVDTLADESDGDFSAGDFSLREAIELANANPDTDTIRFDDRILEADAVIHLNGSDLDITNPLNIFGPGARLLTINGGNESRIFNVDDGDYGDEIDVIVRDLTLSNGFSEADDGGAIKNFENLVVRRVSFFDNAADLTTSQNGGAVWNALGILDVRESLFNGNKAAFGGGIYNQPTGTLLMRNTTLTANSADDSGGGVRTIGPAAIYNSTFTLNFADRDDDGTGDGGGIAIAGVANGNVTLVSTIVAENLQRPFTGNVGQDDLHGGLDTAASGFNLIGTGGTGGLTNGVNNNLVGVNNPGLLPLNNNGGHVDTVAIAGSSPARNAGTDPLGLATDGRDAIFQRTVGSATDIGAYERQVVNPVVSTAVDEFDFNYSPGDLSLREALNFASNEALDTITFDPALNGSTIYLRLGELEAFNRFTLIGPGSGNLTIDAGGRSRALEVRTESSQNNVSISGLRVVNGNSGSSGGGLLMDVRGNVSLDDIVVRNSHSNRVGGGIAVIAQNDIALTSVTAAENSSFEGGGGVYLDSSGTIAIGDARFNNNSVFDPAHSGGGLYASAFDISISNSSAHRNFVPGDGGGFSLNSAATLLIESVSANFNSAEGAGGGAHIEGEDVELVDVATQRNHASGKGGGIHIKTYGHARISGVQADDNLSGASGGGAHIDADSLTADSLLFQRNRARGAGGGLSVITVGHLEMDGFRIVDNETLASAANQNGGGASLAGATARLDNGTINGNIHRNYDTGGGGGLYIDFAQAEILDTTITGNQTTTMGGGLFAINGDVTLARITLTGNTARGLDASGGGIYTSADTTTLVRSIVSGNVADGIAAQGGGIASRADSLLIDRTTVSNNTASLHGGGVYHKESDILIDQSTIAHNTSLRHGGGIYATATNEFVMVNSTVSGNAAYGNGGGLVITLHGARIDNSTIAFNTADAERNWSGIGGGLFNATYSGVYLRSTLFGENRRGAFQSEIQGEDVDITSVRNLFDHRQSSGGLIHGVDNNLVGLDPLLDPLADNGGLTQTHALRAGSPAIDNGSNPNRLRWDQRNTGFPRAVALRTDIGAFEQVFPAPVSAEPVAEPQTPRASAATPARATTWMTIALFRGIHVEHDDHTDPDETTTLWWFGQTTSG